MTNHTWQRHQVFVFGSNLCGIHGAGAAKFAYDNCGAWWEVGQGHTMKQDRDKGGQLRSYALPTCSSPGKPLTIEEVRGAVLLFLAYARMSRDLTFFVTAIGTGLAGFSHDQIKPMFDNAPGNCILPPEWK